MVFRFSLILSLNNFKLFILQIKSVIQLSTCSALADQQFFNSKQNYKVDYYLIFFFQLAIYAMLIWFSNIYISESIIYLIVMSLSICSITGQPLKQPVASLKTGHLYEKQVIQKHLNSFPYCPITNQPMNHSDLVDIVSLDATLLRQDQSPMTYFSKIQHQFNVLAVDAFKLRKSLKETEQQLTHSLYQNQAAQRVIAKLLKQKEDAENEIQKLSVRINQLNN